MLAFFNMRWVDEDGNEFKDNRNPSKQDLYSFAVEIGSIQLKTKLDMKHMLLYYKIQGRIYSYNEEKSLHENLSDFGACLRSLVPVRPGFFEGQHRELLNVLFLYGYYRASSEIPLPRVDFKTEHVMPELARRSIAEDDEDEVESLSNRVRHFYVLLCTCC